MKAYCISDNTDTVMGMRLAGFEGEVIHDREHILAKLQELIDDPEIAIVLMTSKIMEQVSDIVSGYKMYLERPLIVEIPDRHGNGQTGEAIDRYVSEAIGVKL